MKLNVVLRTCDRTSLQSDRIVPKNECVWRCLNSLSRSLEKSKVDFQLHIVDDYSSAETVDKIQTIAPKGTTFDLLPERDQTGLNGKQKSRYSVKQAYDYIHRLPENELVYIVEDDYLHYPDSIKLMVAAYEYFVSLDTSMSIGIFPQDFNQMYPHPENPFNHIYVRPCIVLPGPDRYYRTTWYTQESFLVAKSLITKYRDGFDKLLKIGSDDVSWEGSSLSTVWNKPDVKMLMPLGTHTIHLGAERDISFFVKDWQKLWERNRV